MSQPSAGNATYSEVHVRRRSGPHHGQAEVSVEPGRFVAGLVAGVDGAPRYLRDREGLDPDRLTAFRYRGHGCPGRMRYELDDGTRKEFRYTDFWGTDESQWVLPFRCKVCPDGIGEAADLAAFDTWPGGSPDPATEDADAGTNAVVIRTRAGLDLMHAAEAAGFVTIESDVDPRYMDEVQPHQRKKKLAVRARWDGLAAEGRTVPRSAGLRLDDLARHNGNENNERQFRGTRERVRLGKASEPRPRRRKKAR